MRTKQPAGFSVIITSTKDVETLPDLNKFKYATSYACNFKKVKNKKN
jgi:hypothetical protein